MVKKLSIEDAAHYAKINDGRCLSNQYLGVHSNLLWKCKNKHTFEKPLKRIKNGEWCPYCSGKYVTFTPSELNQIANKRNGKCFSNKTLKISEYTDWQCSNGHQWNAQVNNVVKLSSWCPICKNNTGEEICRLVFEKFTNKKFPSKRPLWLRSKNQSKSMELDGYCLELNIAFEHQGKQHYDDGMSHFESSKVISRDNIKRLICKERGINVLEIPQIGFYISIQEAIKLIRDFLIQNKCEIISEVSEETIFNNKFALYDETLNEIKKIAESKGGKCLSNSYLGHVKPLKFQCKNSHIWLARPNDIKRGSWCSVCAGAGGKKKTIEDLNALTSKFNIACLDQSYPGSKRKLKWECRVGHVFEARYDTLIRRAKKCPYCDSKPSRAAINKF